MLLSIVVELCCNCFTSAQRALHKHALVHGARHFAADLTHLHCEKKQIHQDQSFSHEYRHHFIICISLCAGSLHFIPPGPLMVPIECFCWWPHAANTEIVHGSRRCFQEHDVPHARQRISDIQQSLSTSIPAAVATKHYLTVLVVRSPCTLLSDLCRSSCICVELIDKNAAVVLNH